MYIVTVFKAIKPWKCFLAVVLCLLTQIVTGYKNSNTLSRNQRNTFTKANCDLPTQKYFPATSILVKIWWAFDTLFLHLVWAKISFSKIGWWQQSLEKYFYDKLTANFSQTVTTLGTASVSSRAPQNNSSVKHKSEASSGNFKHTCFSSCFWLRSLHRWLQSKKKRYMVLQKVLSYVKNTKDKAIIDEIKKYYY